MKLIDVRLMLSRNMKAGHFWDQKTFTRTGYPLSLCGVSRLYPRRIDLIMTPDEMKEVPFCRKCLSMIEK